MAQIASDSMLNAFLWDFPFCESLQSNPNIYANFAPYDPGFFTVDRQVVGNTVEFQKSRKRWREEDNRLRATEISSSMPLMGDGTSNIHPCSSLSSLWDCDISVRMFKEQQELEIMILMQMEKMRSGLEQRRWNYCNNVLHTVKQEVLRHLEDKDEEISKIRERNKALEEKVNSLVMEGEIWKRVAENSEAMVLSLRRDIEVAQEREGGDNGGVEDSMSCCEGWKDSLKCNCHGCMKNEISILVLPCRHLCLCSDCDQRFELCPICMSPKISSIMVLMS